jgi:hypothetical protein
MNDRGQPRFDGPVKHVARSRRIVQHVLQAITSARDHSSIGALKIDRAFVIAADAERALMQQPVVG